MQITTPRAGKIVYVVEPKKNPKLDYAAPKAVLPHARFATLSACLSVVCVVPFLGYLGWVRLFHQYIPLEKWMFPFVCSLVGVFTGVVAVDRKPRAPIAWIGLVLNVGVACLFVLLSFMHE